MGYTDIMGTHVQHFHSKYTPSKHTYVQQFLQSIHMLIEVLSMHNMSNISFKTYTCITSPSKHTTYVQFSYQCIQHMFKVLTKHRYVQSSINAHICSTSS
uniref:Uncharacterized protein n=1 Tax=Arion vulgaris TaxID=1028688 RepID=A0A0B6Z918_9EUPU